MFTVGLTYLKNVNTMFYSGIDFNNFNDAIKTYRLLKDFIKYQEPAKISYILCLSQISCSESEYKEMSDDEIETYSKTLECIQKIEGDD